MYFIPAKSLYRHIHRIFPFLHSFCIKQSIRAVTCYTSYETAKIPFKWPGITVHVSAYVIVVASSS